MCGIAGFSSVELNENHLTKMTNVLVHRGPDAEGYFFDSKKGLG